MYSGEVLRNFAVIFTCLMVSSKSFGTLPVNAFTGEGIHLFSDLAISFAYDDNFYQDEYSKTAGIYTVIPGIYAQVISGPDEYRASLEAKRHQYTIIHAESATDYQLNLDIHHEFTRRNRFTGSLVAGRYIGKHQALTGDRKQPQYQQTIVNGKYGFGSLRTRARIDFFGNMTRKEYTSDQYDNSKISLYGATAYYRFLTRTDLLFEVSKEVLAYSGTAGYDIDSYLAGLSFRTSEETAGYFKLGHRFRSSEENQKEGYTGWNTGGSYNIKSYSVVTFRAGEKYEIDSDDPVQRYFARATTVSMAWNHQWRSRRKTVVRWEATWKDIPGYGGKVDKEAVIQTFNVGWTWDARRWFSLSLNWEHTIHNEKAIQPDAEPENYRRNVFTLTGSINL